MRKSTKKPIFPWIALIGLVLVILLSGVVLVLDWSWLHEEYSIDAKSLLAAFLGILVLMHVVSFLCSWRLYRYNVEQNREDLGYHELPE